MAELEVDGERLVVHLSAGERLEAVHGDVQVPLGAVRSVEVEDQPFSVLRGLRAPGTALPGMLAVGTWRGGGRKIFAVVHHGQHAVRIRLQGADFDELLVGVAGPEAMAAALRSALRTP